MQPAPINDSENFVDLGLEPLKESLSYFLVESGVISTLELHRQSGIPRANIERILNGLTENPSHSTLLKLATFFKVSISVLLGDEPLNIPIRQLKQHRIPFAPLNNLDLLFNKKLNELGTIESTWKRTEDTFACLVNTSEYLPTYKNGTILIVDTISEIYVGDNILCPNISNDIYQIIEYFGNGFNILNLKNRSVIHVNQIHEYGVIVEHGLLRRRLQHACATTCALR